jgi:hypothetical protein
MSLRLGTVPERKDEKEKAMTIDQLENLLNEQQTQAEEACKSWTDARRAGNALLSDVEMRRYVRLSDEAGATYTRIAEARDAEQFRLLAEQLGK